MGPFADVFAPLENVLHVVLDFLHTLTASVGLESYGFAIIILTILIKAALYPLTVKQVKSMKAMQELQPQIKKIQDKYRDNPQVLQQKTAELFQKSGVNPLAGCLPLLIQMPILMGMYYALYNFDYAGEPSFYWLPTLSEPDPLYILPVLSALTTYWSQRQTTTTDANSQMKVMMTVMPIFIGWISLSFPSGLVLYWVTMNVVQMIQQWWMYRSDGNGNKGGA